MRLNEELCRAWRTNIWQRVLRNLTNSPIVTASLTILTVAFTDSSIRTIASLLNVEILSMDFFTARKLELESSISRPIANLHRTTSIWSSSIYDESQLSLDRTRSIGKFFNNSRPTYGDEKPRKSSLDSSERDLERTFGEQGRDLGYWDRNTVILFGNEHASGARPTLVDREVRWRRTPIAFSSSTGPWKS